MKYILCLLISFSAWPGLLKFDDVRIIKPKKNKIVQKKARKSFHGKKITYTETKLISTKPTDENPPLLKYVKAVIETLNKALSKELKNSKKAGKASGLFRFQIQSDGEFDLLNINTKSLVHYQAIEKVMNGIEKFPEIPEKTGQTELQLELTFDLK